MQRVVRTGIALSALLAWNLAVAQTTAQAPQVTQRAPVQVAQGAGTTAGETGSVVSVGGVGLTAGMIGALAALAVAGLAVANESDTPVAPTSADTTTVTTTP